ncbi:hypothetical protein [Hyalangium minutum]|uniref:Lipoprotein n=1 Tax=Hyalangium minutum TaxID=394096 RepID=A0A085WU54_9BACT|nr:hypothetical protein [Hyalangium minutum]KFE71217.1 hypothetical protein DB31_3347 [Hyalangium minutum]
MDRAMWKAVVFAGVVGLSLTAGAQPVDEQVSAGLEFLDPEFRGLSATYQDNNRWIWQAPVDPVTGVILSSQRQLIDGQATSLLESFQGPEWVRGSDRILYTKTVDSVPNLWIKRPGMSPAQITAPPAARYLLTGILTSRGTVKVVYRRKETLAGGGLSQGVYWLDTATPSVEHLLPGADLGVAPVSWIPGTEDLVYTQQHDMDPGPREQWVSQLVRLSTATGAITVLTSDLDAKEDSFAFQAPEAQQALRYATVVNGGTLRIYGESAAAWVDLQPPSQLGFMYSPEVFQARDSQGTVRTYFVVVMRASTNPGDVGEVWVLGLNGSALRVDGGTASQPRQPADPEVIAGSSEIFVYYNNSANLALWRSRTGLAVP